MYRQTAPTMNLFPINEKTSEVSAQNVPATRNIQSMDLFPQPAGFAAPFPKEEFPKIPDSRWAHSLILSYAFSLVFISWTQGLLVVLWLIISKSTSEID